MSVDESFNKTLVRPLFTINRDDEKAVLDWCRNALAASIDSQRDELRRYNEHMQLYKGRHWQTDGKAPEKRAPESQGGEGFDNESDTPDITVNHIFDTTQQKVSRMSRFKPVVVVSPANSEDYQDKIAARRVKEYVDYLTYRDELEKKFSLADLVKYIGAKAYMWIFWDDKKGDLDEDYERLAKQGPVPLVDDHGEQVKLGDQPVFVEKKVYQGDVDFEVVTPNKVFTQPLIDFDKSSWVFREFVEDVDILRARYKGKNITDTQSGTYIEDLMGDQSETLEKRKNLNQIRYWELWHKKTEFLPDGYYACFTESELLEKKKHPEKHGEFPCERICDVLVPDEEPMSNYENIRTLNAQVNMLETMKTKNHILGSHLHWIAPQGMTKKERLANGDTVLWFRGPVPPRLEIFPVVTNDMVNTGEKAEQNIQKLSGVFGVSRGEPPPGIKAFVALNFLEEQENERANAEVVDKSKFIIRVWKKALAVAANHISPDDKRFVRLMGKENAFEARKLDVLALSKDWDIRLQNSTTLPQSKSGRMQALLEIDERRPGMIPNEQMADYLDLGGYGDFTNEATRSLRTAQYENARFMEGLPVPEPKAWEDLMVHWRVHFSGCQSSFFRYEMPEHLQKAHLTHLETTEYIMIEKAKRNPTFAAKLQMVPEFPAVFVLPAPALPMSLPPPSGEAPLQMMPPGAPLPPDEAGEQEPVYPIEPLDPAMVQ